MNPSDLRALALVSIALALCACADAAMVAPAAPPAPAAAVSRAVSADDPSSAAGALAALDHAEAELGRALGAPGGYAPAPAASAAPEAPGQPMPPPPPPPPATAKPADSGASKAAAPSRDREAPGGQADACSTACTALASMERATDHLCGLAGAGDARCQSARTRVTDATARVRAACPACAR